MLARIHHCAPLVRFSHSVANADTGHAPFSDDWPCCYNFWTAVVPAVARVTPEVILAPRLTSILARRVVPCQRFAFERTILRPSILDGLRRTIVPGGVVRFFTLRSFCRPAGGLLAPPIFLAMCSTVSSALLSIYGVCDLLCLHLTGRRTVLPFGTILCCVTPPIILPFLSTLGYTADIITSLA